MPYVGLDGTSFIRVGKVRLIKAEDFIPQIADEPMRNRVGDILNMHREKGRNPANSRPVRGIGILVVGQPDFRQFNAAEIQLLRDFRTMLFLSCLANNNRLHGPNAGSFVYTAENFDIVDQTFDLSREYVAESAGAVISMMHMGYKLGETAFFRPAHVPTPTRFRTDEKLLNQLDWLRQRQRALYTRIIRSAAVFLESYYNAPNVDVRARILLQAAAFEILLALPEGTARQVFKDHVERLTNLAGERRFVYSFEISGGRRRKEKRSVKGIWADRFFTLRNHIIHGEIVRHGEYVFRGHQSHFVIVPLFFVMIIERLIDEARTAKGQLPFSTDRLHWTTIQRRDEHEPEVIGFKMETDYYRAFELQGARKARRQRRQTSTTIEVKESEE